MVAIGAESIMDAPCPRVGVTVSGLGPGDHVVTVWRTSDSDRVAVRGARMIPVVDSFYVEDYEAPLGRAVSYALEVLSGVDAGVQGITGEALIDSPSGFVQDPLDPSSAIAVRVGPRQKGHAVLAGSFASTAYDAPVSTFNVLGARRPVAIGGVRAAGSGVPFSVLTESEAENVRFRELVESSALLLIRGLPSWGSRVPGSAVYTAASVTEKAAFAGDEGPTIWETSGDVVRGSSARVVAPLWSYQDVGDIFATYDQKQAAAGGGTYLDDQKNPANV